MESIPKRVGGEGSFSKYATGRESSPVVTRLYIGGLDYSTHEEHLAELLSQHGITALRIELAKKLGQPLGFGFVRIAGQDAERAIHSINGQIFRGRVLKIERAGPKNRGRKARERRFGPQSHRRFSE